MADIRKVIQDINRVQGNSAVFLGKDWKKPEIERISTSSLYLDWATGGGIPTGRITEIFGNESAGKSALAAKIVAQAQKKKLSCLWIDAEHVFDPDWMERLGVNTEFLAVVQEAEGEKVHDMLMKAVSLGNPKVAEFKDFEPVDVVVVDSWAALTPMVVTDNDMQTHMAVDARMNNLGIKRVNARNYRTAVIVVNQNRSGIGGRVPFDFQPGGRGLKFYASLRIELRTGEPITPNKVPDYMPIPSNPKDKDTPVGHNVRVRLRKCKVGPPHREANFDFYYNGKMDPIKDIITVGKITGVVDQGGAFYKYNEESFRGAKAFADHLKGNPAVLRDLRNKVLATI